MRVLFADKLPEQSKARLERAGFEVAMEPALDGDPLAARLREWDPEVLVVRSTKVTAAHATAGRRLALVVRAGAGVNTIDVQACSGRGIYVTNCPGKNAVAVAELAMGLLVALDRRIVDNAVDLRAGRWAKGEYSKASGLRGRTLGVLGTGDIGQAVIRRALAFGMHVVAWSRSLTDEKAAGLGVTRLGGPKEVAAACHALTVHLALVPDTRNLVDAAVLGALRPGAIFLNTSRAEVVDEPALLAAIDEKKLRVGLDVFANEPSGNAGAFDSAIAKHPRVIGTHHIGASTDEAQEAVGDEACRIIEAFRDDGRVLNGVNTVLRSAATHRLTVRHHDRVGVLAAVLGCLREAGINVQEMDNVIFPSGAAIAKIRLAGEPPLETVARLQGLEHVMDASVVAL